ncbi:BPTD_3080 family restriction endonuclease [uncultured Tistrella sp.]|uniref:BPTD_3080 family restriction endonuclease n=1 Tax=Tistrella mobilis TaxID=171437 RepID=UPI0026120525|nr:DEAD/DEAH box helicase family protein [uncultured Tistrella sp.]
MTQSFFDRPILNSPYLMPDRHWELVDGQPTDRIIPRRRRSDLVTPVPQPQKRRSIASQAALDLGGRAADRGEDQVYNPTPIINEVRALMEDWRRLPNPNDWKVTPETARLLKHWRSHNFQGVRPFFCQIEAVETAIWLTEVAPHLGERSRGILAHLKQANREFNGELFRMALKLATGAGKTTVMAMLIAWQTVNALRHPGSRRFSRGFLIVAPGITIRDRLRVLLPNDPESYYKTREIVPPDLLPAMNRAIVVITNYHAFKLRETLELSKGNRALLEGRTGPKLSTLETEGQMIQRVMPELAGLRDIVVLNDEAHHCYRPKLSDAEGSTEADLKGDEKKQAQDDNETARLWFSGIEAVRRRLGLALICDLSATPFFLAGSGYREGALFPWTMSDFSLMDAIECGIVKLPRVPIADNMASGDMPMFRNLWDHIGKKMPKKGKSRSGGGGYDPLSLPSELQTALAALYGHYEKVFALWQQQGIGVPPVFIVVCNNTTTSDLVYRYISGFYREEETNQGDAATRTEDGGLSGPFEQGRLALFRNFDDYGNPLPRRNTILIDSAQLESGEGLSDAFRAAAADEIAEFRREIVERTGDQRAAESIDDATLLREVMNTVGKRGRLGEQVRCVVSVSMLTEGWDANTVTHILGVRAFGTQLLCEQVVGRGLRRQSYELNADGLFDVEYADILGIPFDFTAKAVVAPPAIPRETVRVRAVRPERDPLEIVFPRVEGYRVDLPDDRIDAEFSADSVLELTPDLVGPSIVKCRGIVGEEVDLTVEHLDGMRPSTVIYHLTRHMLYTRFRDPGEAPKLHLFGQMKRVVRRWMEGWLRCAGGTTPAQLIYTEIADMAAERIIAAINRAILGQDGLRSPGGGRIRAILDPYNPSGSSRHVNFTTSKPLRWQTSPDHCHVDLVICDSEWEAEFCRVAEAHPQVRAYVKNQGLGLEVPYLDGNIPHRYLPDFILRIDDGRPDLLNLIVEIKGFRGRDARIKAETMHTHWVPGVNNLGQFGRWAFAEFTAVYEIEAAFARLMEEVRGQMAA